SPTFDMDKYFIDIRNTNCKSHNLVSSLRNNAVFGADDHLEILRNIPKLLIRHGYETQILIPGFVVYSFNLCRCPFKSCEIYSAPANGSTLHAGFRPTQRTHGSLIRRRLMHERRARMKFLSRTTIACEIQIIRVIIRHHADRRSGKTVTSEATP